MFHILNYFQEILRFLGNEIALYHPNEVVLLLGFLVKWGKNENTYSYAEVNSPNYVIIVWNIDSNP